MKIKYYLCIGCISLSNGLYKTTFKTGFLKKSTIITDEKHIVKSKYKL